MAETINDSIANYILTTITAPSLADVKYAENIETVFNNINDNFNKLSSTPFLQGADGKSFEHYEVKVYDKNQDKDKKKEKGLTKYGAALLNAVFGDILEQKGVDKIIFTEGDVKDKIHENIEKVPAKCGVKAINNIYNIDGLLDETIYGYGIKNDADEFKEDTIVITSPVQLIDSRLACLSDIETADDGLYYFRDTSCMLKCITEKVKVNEEYKINIRFVKMYLVATIYYDNDNDQWSWVINGKETHISATGKKGDDGTSANAWVVKTSTKNDRGPCDITHFYAENSKLELEWIPVGDMKELPADGDYAFVYVDRDVNNSTTPYHKDWTFSTIYVKDKTYRVYYDVDYSISQFMKDVTANDIFGTIGKTATDFSRGIWLRQDEKNVKSDHLHALYSEDGTLKLSCVSNQDMDPTQEINTIESQQLEVNYDTEIKGNTSIDGNVQITLPQDGSIDVGDLVYKTGDENVITMNQTQVNLNSVFTNINGDITIKDGDLSIGDTLISTSDEIGTTKAYSGDDKYLFESLSTNVITPNMSAVNIESSNSVSTNVILLPNMIIAPSIALDKAKTKQYFGISGDAKTVSLTSGKRTKTFYVSTPINMALKTNYSRQYNRVSNTGGHSAATLSKSWDLSYSYTYSPNIDTIKRYAVEIANKNGSSISTDLIESLKCNITVSVTNTPVTLTQVMKFEQPYKSHRSVYRLYEYASSESEAKRIYNNKTSDDRIEKYGVWSETSSKKTMISGASKSVAFKSEDNSTPKISISGNTGKAGVGTSITVFGEGTGSSYAIDYKGVVSSNLSTDTLPITISIEFTEIKIFSKKTDKSDKFLLDNTGLYNFIYITEDEKETTGLASGWYFRSVEWGELKSADKFTDVKTGKNYRPVMISGVEIKVPVSPGRVSATGSTSQAQNKT